MKGYFIFAIAMLSYVSVEAQFVKELPITSTDNLIINTPAKVFIYKSDTLKVLIKTEKKNPDWLAITPGPDGLTIDHTGKFDNDDFASIEIYTNRLNTITVNGDGDVKIADDFTIPDINITLNGNSSLTGTVFCEKAKLVVSGSSYLKLLGTSNNVEAVVSGSSDLKLLDFQTKTMNITTSGASDNFINVTEELNAVASGSSDIRYKSDVAKMKTNATGSADIKKFDPESSYYYENDFSNLNNSNPQESKRFAATFSDMFGGGKMHESLVWMGIDLGMDGLVDMTNGFDLQPQGAYNFMEMNYWRNTNIRLNFFEWRFNLVKNVFNIVTGMGIDFQHYAFAQKIKFEEADDYPGLPSTTPVIGVTDSLHGINRSRLAVQYFNIPLFFNLRTKKTAKNTNQFNFTFGVVGGIRTGSSSRIQYVEQGNDVKEEKFDDFNLETFTATAMVRIKYSFFSIYASYQFTPMFRGQNPNLYPFSIGVTMLSW